MQVKYSIKFKQGIDLSDVLILINRSFLANFLTNGASNNYYDDITQNSFILPKSLFNNEYRKDHISMTQNEYAFLMENLDENIENTKHNLLNNFIKLFVGGVSYS